MDFKNKLKFYLFKLAFGVLEIFKFYLIAFQILYVQHAWTFILGLFCDVHMFLLAVCNRRTINVLMVRMVIINKLIFIPIKLNNTYC